MIAEVLPEQKLEIVEAECKDNTVMMVGDGINDALALARGDVGVAIGAAGSDVALQSADVALMSDDLRRLPSTMQLARSTRRIIHQNVLVGAGLSVLIRVSGLGWFLRADHGRPAAFRRTSLCGRQQRPSTGARTGLKVIPLRQPRSMLWHTRRLLAVLLLPLFCGCDPASLAGNTQSAVDPPSGQSQSRRNFEQTFDRWKTLIGELHRLEMAFYTSGGEELA